MKLQGRSPGLKRIYHRLTYLLSRSLPNESHFIEGNFELRILNYLTNAFASKLTSEGRFEASHALTMAKQPCEIPR